MTYVKRIISFYDNSKVYDDLKCVKKIDDFVSSSDWC